MNTEERIIKVLEGINEKILTYSGENMMEDGTLDSFELIEIVSQLEEEFDIEIDAELAVVENFANKETIIALMKKILNE
ncbi:MAG TPA: phosphopantetheine-binding protein [Methanocorpusculum sp.]|nr:phosphopantetheine-binding protein [Methanocorpusculum sp.]